MAHYTQIAILQVFEQMLTEQPFDRITVTALVKRCGISSNTFYYHYRDIYDLLDAWLRQNSQRYLEERGPGEGWEETAKRVLRDVKARKTLAHHIFDSISRERLERYIFESVENTFYKLVCDQVGGGDVPEEKLRYLAGFCCYSFLGFLMKFLWNDMDADVDRAVDQLSDILNGFIGYTLSRESGG